MPHLIPFVRSRADQDGCILCPVTIHVIQNDRVLGIRFVSCGGQTVGAWGRWQSGRGGWRQAGRNGKARKQKSSRYHIHSDRDISVVHCTQHNNEIQAIEHCTRIKGYLYDVCGGKLSFPVTSWLHSDLDGDGLRQTWRRKHLSSIE